MTTSETKPTRVLVLAANYREGSDLMHRRWGRHARFMDVRIVAGDDPHGLDGVVLDDRWSVYVAHGAYRGRHYGLHLVALQMATLKAPSPSSIEWFGEGPGIEQIRLSILSEELARANRARAAAEAKARNVNLQLDAAADRAVWQAARLQTARATVRRLTKDAVRTRHARARRPLRRRRARAASVVGAADA